LIHTLNGRTKIGYFFRQVPYLMVRLLRLFICYVARLCRYGNLFPSRMKIAILRQTFRQLLAIQAACWMIWPRVAPGNIGESFEPFSTTACACPGHHRISTVTPCGVRFVLGIGGTYGRHFRGAAAPCAAGACEAYPWRGAS
jgi:hypothetical protein